MSPPSAIKRDLNEFSYPPSAINLAADVVRAELLGNRSVILLVAVERNRDGAQPSLALILSTPKTSVFSSQIQKGSIG